MQLWLCCAGRNFSEFTLEIRGRSITVLFRFRGTLFLTKITMALRKSFIPEFSEFIPSKLEEGVLYISIPYSRASHKCACGCGLVVVTPFSEPDWDLIYNRDGVSLDPSIGNWSFPCESHYWI